jgi:hypothetical protein
MSGLEEKLARDRRMKRFYDRMNTELSARIGANLKRRADNIGVSFEGTATGNVPFRFPRLVPSRYPGTTPTKWNGGYPGDIYTDGTVSSARR